MPDCKSQLFLSSTVLILCFIALGKSLTQEDKKTTLASFTYEGPTQQNPQPPAGKKTVLRLEPSENNPRNSEGDFIQLNDGRLLFIYSHFTEGDGDHASAYLAGRYSDDGGVNWTTQDEVIIPNEGEMNVMSVSLLRLANGNIALFYLRKNSTSDLMPLMRISEDEANTWSKPTACIQDQTGYFVMNNDRAIQLANERIILPVSLHKTPNTAWSGTGRLWCYYSDNQGRSWQRSREVPNPEEIDLQEPGVVALNDGRLMMFIRNSSGVQYLSYSEDQGETWSPAQPSTIKSPRSPASVERIPSTGDLLMVWNNNGGENETLAGKRTPLNTAISQDEGKTWKNSKVIESNPAGWYCYTAIDFVDNHVLLGYCAGDRNQGNGLSTTQITLLDQTWLYQEESDSQN